MKKITQAFIALILFLSVSLNAQDLVITGVYDGPLSGGTPKGVELYVLNNVADMSIYGLGSANNGGGSDGEEFTFPAVAAIAGDFIYVSSESPQFTVWFGFAPDYTSGAMSINGDDAVELFTNGIVTDVFGDINVDGNGEPWEYLDGWAYRVNNTGPDGSTFVLANFTYSGPNALDGETTNATAATPVPIGTYTVGGVPTVVTPAITPASGDYFAQISVGMTTSTDGASIYYTTDGTDPDETDDLFTAAFDVSTTTTVKARAYKSGMTESSIAENVYTFPTVTDMTTIAALRAETPGTGDYYFLSEEVVLTFQQSFGNQKYVQDASAAILIYDSSGEITTTYDIYDGITGILGTLSEYGGMLQFLPATDPGTPSSTANTITPQIVSLSQITNNFEDYEAELVKVEGVTFTDAGANFANGTEYVITDALSETYDFRTTFYSVDYIGTQIPAGPQDLILIPNSRTDGDFVTSRSLTDINPASGGNSAVKLDITSVNGGNPVTEGQPFNITVQAQDIFDVAANVDTDVNVTITLGTGAGTLGGTLTGTIPSGSNSITISDITYTPFETAVVLNVSDDASNLTSGNSDAFDVIELVVVDIVITEIMYNAMGGSDTLEYFEIYNKGVAPANLENFEITQGVSHTFGNVTIAAGGYLVVARSASNMMDAFGISAVEWTSGGLSNSGEDIEIRNTFDMVVAFVDYGVSSPWPPKETGKSIRFCDPSLDNNDPANWSISVEYLATIGGDIIYGTPLADCGEANPAVKLDITNINNGQTVFNGEPFSITVHALDVNDILANVDADVNVTLSVETGSGTLGGTIIGTIVSGTNSIIISDITYSPFETGVVLNISDDASNLTAGNSDPFDVVEIVIVDLVINEIMYNTPDADEEWVELYNNTNAVIELENWQLLDNDDSHMPIIIPSGHSVAPGGYFTIVIATAGNFPFTPDYDGSGNFNLNNSGDEIRIWNSDGFLVDNVAYTAVAPWPTEPNGSGPSLALLAPDLDNSLAVNWAASNENGGTPGAINFPLLPFVTVISPNGGEIIYQNSDFDINWIYGAFEGDIKIELFRDGQTAIELITDIAASTGTYLWSVGESFDIATDYKIVITALITEAPFDESDDFFSIEEPIVIPNLVITEIMYNPPESGNDSLEFLEIYNLGEETVSLEGIYFSEGIDYVFPDVEILPNTFLLVSIDSLAMMQTFNVEAYQWTGGALSNGGEDIEIKDVHGNIIDFVEYDDALPWDTLADGFGHSLTLCNPEVDNNIAENWTHSEYFMALNAEGDSIWATPGFGCQVSLLAQFEADVTLILVGNSVQFTDLTIGNPISWLWTFEGGTPATFDGQNPPAIVYNDAGIWDVSLAVNDGISTHNITYVDYIRSGIDPVADFEATFTVVTVGSYTNFINNSIGDELTYDWYFEGGDPETSTNEDPGDIYYLIFDVTTYDVRLIVSNDFGVDTLTRVDYIQTIPDAIVENPLSDIIIYPNPTDEFFTIEITDDSLLEVLIRDISGREVYKMTIKNTTKVNVSYLQKGIYLVSLYDKSSNNMLIKKLIVK